MGPEVRLSPKAVLFTSHVDVCCAALAVVKLPEKASPLVQLQMMIYLWCRYVV